MQEKYKSINRFGSDEITINKSRFIGYAKPIDNEQEAIEFIDEIKSKHKDATHNIPVYVVGENSNIQRYSDDGEPSGTAGIPVLEVIKKENLRNVAVVVTRYYGGIKLGTGGLVRAYTKGAKIALEAAIIVDKILFKRLNVKVDYTLYGKVENDLLSNNYIIESVKYDEAVNITVLVENAQYEKLYFFIVEITSARAHIAELNEEYFSVKDGKIIR